MDQPKSNTKQHKVIRKHMIRMNDFLCCVLMSVQNYLILI